MGFPSIFGLLVPGIVIGTVAIAVIIKIINENKRNNKALTLGSKHENLEGKSLSGGKYLMCSETCSPSHRSNSSSRLSMRSFDDDDEMFSARASSDSDEYFDLTSDEEELNRSSEGLSVSETSCFSNEGTKTFFEEVDILLNSKETDCFNGLRLLQQGESELSDNPGFLWRMAKAHKKLAIVYEAQNNVEEKKEHIFRGVQYAAKALKLDPTNGNVHKWYAILIGMKTEFLPFREKLKSGLKFYGHLRKALEILPNDSELFHLIGRFKYEVANMSWIEKKLVAALDAEFPSFEMEEALCDFKRTEKLNLVPWKENRLFIAKCYIAAGNYSEAMTWLNSTKSIVCSEENLQDQACDRECDLLISRYEAYVNN